MELPVSLGNRVGVEQGVRGPAGVHGAGARGRDGAVEDDVCHVDAAGVELAGQRLAEGAQAELAHREAREVGRAAERGGGAGEQDGAAAEGEHAGDDLAGAEEAAEAVGLPAGLELLGGDVGHRAREEGARVVDEDVGIAEPGSHRGEGGRDAGGIGGVGGERGGDAAGGGDLSLDVLEGLAAAGEEGHAVPRAREAAGDGRAQAGAHTEDCGDVRGCHGPTKGLLAPAVKVPAYAAAMSADPSIRHAVAADADAIARVQVASWRVAYAGLMPAALLAGLSVEQRAIGWRVRLESAQPEYRCFVMEGDAGAGGDLAPRQVLGFASSGPSRDGGADLDTLEVYAFYLDPRAWGRGLGRALFAAAIDDARRRGHPAATLWVLEGNARARRFYEAAGMRPDGAARIEVEEGVALPHLRYWLSLRPATRG